MDKEIWLKQLAEAIPYVLEKDCKQAIRDRAKGLFEHANWAEERAHQLRNYNWILWGDFRGMESACEEELLRVYGPK